ncbi:MAG: ice-binding family protein [Balneolaceae bacterium]
MNSYITRKQSTTYIRGSGIYFLTIAIALLLAITAIAQPTIPSLSLSDSAAVNLPHKLNLIWNASATAETYQLQISDTSSFTTTVYDQSQLTDTVEFVTVLDFSTTYYWRVAASNGTGTSNFSSLASFTTWGSVPNGPDPVDLGLLDTFAIIAYSAVTNVPSSAIKGDVGLTPTSGSFIDLTEGEVTGTIFTVDASGPAGSVESAVMLTEAKGDLTIAYNDAAGRTLAPVGIAGNIGGQTLYPSLYKSTGTLEISAGDLTLDANGNEDAVWIFQIASSFNMTSDRKVFLVNGAKAGNIFWQMGSAATFGTTTVMKGTIMAGTQVTFATGASLDGRALALTENVTLQQNVINVPVSSSTVGIEEVSQFPKGINLSQNYPNPFNPTTNIRFGINETSDVRLDVFNMLGQHVATLVNEQKAAGWYTVNFDASNFSSGFYMYRITANSSQVIKKMTLIK